MAAGLGVLRLPPASFWAMTPTELAAALGSIIHPAGLGPPSRYELSRLMQRFPDRRPDRTPKEQNADG